MSNAGYVIGSAAGAAATGAIAAFVGAGSPHPVVKSAIVMAAVGALIAGVQVGYRQPTSGTVSGPPPVRFP